MKILVIGSTGFVGKNLLAALSETEHEVATCQRSTGTDVREYSQIHKVVVDKTPDIIYNLASHGGSVHYVKSNAAAVYNDNVQMSLNLYRAVSEVNAEIKIIQPFSNCSYPGDSSIQHEEDWLNGQVHQSVFSFGNSKRSMFYISECYRQQYGIKSVNMLFPNTYGPGDSIDPNHTHALNGMIIRMLKAKSEGQKEFSVWGTGSPVREWAYIDDFINALVMSIDIESMEYPVNMGQEKGYSIADSASLIKKACGFQGDIVFDTKYQDGDPVKVLGNKKFLENFPNFEFYNHFEGIKNTVKYYEELL